MKKTKRTITIDQIWNLGARVPNYDPSQIRKDACGAWIIKDQYNKTSSFGWSVDRISPFVSKDCISNLRPMHVANIQSKAKSYPTYRAVITSDGTKNIRCSKLFFISPKKQEELQGLSVKDEIITVK